MIRSTGPALTDSVTEDFFYAPDRGNGLSGSLVLAPDSICEFLNVSCRPSGSRMVSVTGGRSVQIASVFANDAERAEEPQNLRLNGEEQARVRSDRDLWELVERVDALAAPHTREVTEIASQRPGIALRQAIQEEFVRRYGHQPIFDSKGVIDSSVSMEIGADRRKGESHLTGMIRMVLIQGDDPDEMAEPTALAKPIIYDGLAVLDQMSQTVEYRIDFFEDEGPSKKKAKFCAIL